MLESKYSNILLGTSFSMLLLATFLYYLEFKQVAFLYLVLFITSINHWKNPNYDLKRTIDIYMVMITTIVGMVYASELNYDLDYYMYYITAFYTLLLFVMSNLLYRQNEYLSSILIHGKIHLICLIGNCMMFYCIKNELR
jgi:hypothetical protein